MFKTSDMKRSSVQKYTRLSLPAVIVMICSLPTGAFAAGPPVPSEMSKPMAQVLMVIIAALLLMIALLANVVNGAAQVYLQKYREAKKAAGSGNATKIFSLLVLCLIGSGVFAADAPAAAAATTAAADTGVGGLSSISFYALISVIGVEIVILLVLLYNLKLLLRKESIAIAAIAGEEAVAPAPAFNWNKWWWEKVNVLRPESEEANIDLGHDYDGIRELDNRLPPWWLYGFYLCIIVAFIYIYRFHISHSAPSSSEEFQIAMTVADAEKEEFLKNSANKVDENTVTYLSDAASLGEGKKIFTTICAACHQADGGGAVGPNLTDDYYLHGGGIKDLFKTIKYGWPEKGMKSWKDDYSPVQIAQLASYVKSLRGTKPGKPKEPQGTLYDEKAAAPAAKPGAAVDSTKPAAADKKAVPATTLP